MNINKSIDKLVVAFLVRGKLIKINSNKLWSRKYKKMFTKYTVIETTETEIELKQKLYELIKENKRNSVHSEEITELKRQISEINIPAKEFTNKVGILKHLASRYKELIE